VIVAYTGPSQLGHSQRTWAAWQMLSLKLMRGDEVEKWATGCQYGIDTLAAQIGDAIWQDVVLYVPAAPHNGHLVNSMKDDHETIYCPERESVADSYRMRNRLMIEGADLLVAFVNQGRFYRSGEWMTINLARKLGVKVELAIMPVREGEKFAQAR